MRPAQKRNRGENPPRFIPNIETTVLSVLGLVSRAFLSHCLFFNGIEGSCMGNFLRLTKLRQFRQRNVPGESKRAQCANAVPVWIHFVPSKPMSRCLRNRMVIVMPAF